MAIKLTTQEFVNKANKIHNSIWDYSKSVYINRRTNIEIICKIHGSFYQIPGNHLFGDICPKCAKKNTGNKQKFNTEIFITKAQKIHGNRWCYSKSNYIKMNNKAGYKVISIWESDWNKIKK